MNDKQSAEWKAPPKSRFFFYHQASASGRKQTSMGEEIRLIYRG